MIQKFILLIMALTFFVTIQNAKARSPAIEPVMGISIEEREVINPEDAKGFDFRNQEPNDEIHRRPAITSEQIQYVQNLGAEEINRPSLWIGVLLALACLLMPLTIWIFAFSSYRQKNPQSTVSQDNSNVQNLDEIREQIREQRKTSHQDNQNDDEDLPKAS